MRRIGGLVMLAVFGAGSAHAAVMTPVSQARKVLLRGPGVVDGGNYAEQLAPDFSEFDAALTGPVVGPPTFAVLSTTQLSLIRPDVLAGLGSASAAWVGIGPDGLAGSILDVHFTLTETTAVVPSGVLERGSDASAYGALSGPSGVLNQAYTTLLAPLTYTASLPAGEYRLYANAWALPVDAALGSTFARWTISLAVVPEPTTLALGALGLLLVRRRVRK